jgi:hypothetical protein
MSTQHNRPLDFWRAYLKDPYLKDPKNKQDRSTLERAIQQAIKFPQIATSCYKELGKRRFLWSLKQDGYQVRLIRAKNGTWSIHTRRRQLNPPREFLQGLEKNQELPSCMFGELVTGFTGCSEDARKCKFTRTTECNRQFALIHRVLEKQDAHAWDKLRIVLFAFPTESDISIWDAYDKYRLIMQKTFSHHPHIGMCKCGPVRTTQHAIEIFQSVVQMGFEGIVIVDGDERYSLAQFYKLKPKETQQVQLKPLKDRWGVVQKQESSKDGQNVCEYTYEVKTVYLADMDCWPQAKFVNNVKFLDMQEPSSLSLEEWQVRDVKWMEFVPESSLSLCPQNDNKP